MKGEAICQVCGYEFKKKSDGDKYCSITCLNVSITDKEQQDAIDMFTRLVQMKVNLINCPICGRNYKFLVHKRMNGCWYLYQEYHYDNDKKSILACYHCNLLEKIWRKRWKETKANALSPDDLRKLIRKDEVEL